MQTPRALVTGASGFLGSVLSETLAARGWHVNALVRDPNKPGLPSDKNIRLVYGDITQPATLPAAVEGVDLVFHCAAVVGPTSLTLAEFERVNVEGTRHLLSLCGSAKRVIYVSTVAVLGEVGPGRLADEGDPARPQDSYGASKHASEQLIEREFAGLPVVIARPSWVYGWRSPGFVHFVKWVTRGRMFMIGKAQNRIQPIAVSDMIEGLIACATTQGIESRTYHFAGPSPITINEFCRQIASAAGAREPRLRIPMPLAATAAALCDRFYPSWLGTPPITTESLEFFRVHYAYSNERAKAELDWSPKIDFAQGALDAVSEMRRRRLL